MEQGTRVVYNGKKIVDNDNFILESGAIGTFRAEGADYEAEFIYIIWDDDQKKLARRVRKSMVTQLQASNI